WVLNSPVGFFAHWRKWCFAYGRYIQMPGYIVICIKDTDHSGSHIVSLIYQEVHQFRPGTAATNKVDGLCQTMISSLSLIAW
ncbi:MAG: hypothetical protein SVM80_06135, partial [Halobacteriota archaeon]|nr:hypothetical protein [Halobacteriota archaeon]